PVRKHDDARAELEPSRARGDGGQRGHDLGDGNGRREAIGEPDRVDVALLEHIAEGPQEISGVTSRRPWPRHNRAAVLERRHGPGSYAGAPRTSRRPAPGILVGDRWGGTGARSGRAFDSRWGSP